MLPEVYHLFQMSILSGPSYTQTRCIACLSCILVIRGVGSYIKSSSSSSHSREVLGNNLQSDDGTTPFKICLKMEPPLARPDIAKARARASRVVLLSSDTYIQSLSRMAVNSGREVMLADLLDHSGIMSWLTVVEPAKATEVHLSRFHALDYIDTIRDNDPSEKDSSLYLNEGAINKGKIWKRQRFYKNTTSTLDDFGLTDDCALFPGVFDYACRIAGASLQAADLLCRGSFGIAINWGGGRHHAVKDKASGYCFVNDVVLAILHLRRRFRRVLYVDIDVHHGDGVEEAFYFDSSVMTISLHHEAPGFFPNNHTAKNVGEGDGIYSTVNLPLKVGATDESFVGLFEKVFNLALESFKPDATVLCCGCDALGGDPLGRLNLSTRGIAQAVKHASDQCIGRNVPLLLLGGGGYNPSTTARAWTCATAAAMGEYVEENILPEFVPEHCVHFAAHGPEFSMHPLINQSHFLTDNNSPEHYHRLYTHAKRILYKYRTKVSYPSSSDFTSSFLNNCSTLSSSSSSSASASASTCSSSTSLSSSSLSSLGHQPFNARPNDTGTDTGHEMHDDNEPRYQVETAAMNMDAKPLTRERKRDAFDFDE